MQRSIGLALPALLMALAAASPACAAAQWWYAGDIPQQGYFYVDISRVEIQGSKATVRGRMIYPDRSDGLYAYTAVVECASEDAHFARVTHGVDGVIQEVKVEMGDAERLYLVATGCMGLAQWSRFGFEPVANPVVDAFERIEAQ